MSNNTMLTTGRVGALASFAIAGCVYYNTGSAETAFYGLLGVYLPIVGSIWLFFVLFRRKDYAVYSKWADDRKNKRGVSMIVWLFWLVVFFPALIVVAIIHTGRKNRYALGERK